jgi:hypothetical protein
VASFIVVNMVYLHLFIQDLWVYSNLWLSNALANSFNYLLSNPPFPCSKEPNLPKMHCTTTKNLQFNPNEVLLLFLLDTLIVDRVFSCLPMILSLSWHLCQISKSWFRVMSENMAWNALEITTVNQRSYFQSIIIHEIVK